ncbi:putative DUF1707 family protein [Corynebacterium uterequi]|uniref:Putative DUF1707 family protein n=2 Tax=Corynebacterium uterequi TaxID=1072256 RepID=A0A0G3HF99_9CORY|nr:putative DUF1707 family protein [Corynebacterium uterequi]
MTALGEAFSEGRITVDEYDERCRVVSAARFPCDVESAFADLPFPSAGAGHNFAVAVPEPVFTASEIDRLHRASQRNRAGVVALTTIGTIAAGTLFAETTAGLSLLLMLAVPIVVVLLYVMKVGPSSWYQPSVRQLRRARMREIEQRHALETAEKRARDRIEAAELRARRHKLSGEISTEILEVARRGLGKMKH